jgi:hypothetical protein
MSVVTPKSLSMAGQQRRFPEPQGHLRAVESRHQAQTPHAEELHPAGQQARGYQRAARAHLSAEQGRHHAPDQQDDELEVGPRTRQPHQQRVHHRRPQPEELVVDQAGDHHHQRHGHPEGRQAPDHAQARQGHQAERDHQEGQQLGSPAQQVRSVGPRVDNPAAQHHQHQHGQPGQPLHADQAAGGAAQILGLLAAEVFDVLAAHLAPLGQDDPPLLHQFGHLGGGGCRPFRVVRTAFQVQLHVRPQRADEGPARRHALGRRQTLEHSGKGGADLALLLVQQHQLGDAQLLPSARRLAQHEVVDLLLSDQGLRQVLGADQVCPAELAQRPFEQGRSLLQGGEGIHEGVPVNLARHALPQHRLRALADRLKQLAHAGLPSFGRRPEHGRLREAALLACCPGRLQVEPHELGPGLELPGCRLPQLGPERWPAGDQDGIQGARKDEECHQAGGGDPQSGHPAALGVRGSGPASRPAVL